MEQLKIYQLYLKKHSDPEGEPVMVAWSLDKKALINFYRFFETKPYYVMNDGVEYQCYFKEYSKLADFMPHLLPDWDYTDDGIGIRMVMLNPTELQNVEGYKVIESYEEACERVIDFWVEKAFLTPLNKNNGDENAMMFLLANKVSQIAREDLTPQKIQYFRTKLKQILLREQHKSKYITLDVDYTPCQTLMEAIDYANIDFNCFPWKTNTFIAIDKLYTRAGAKYQYQGKTYDL